MSTEIYYPMDTPEWPNIRRAAMTPEARVAITRSPFTFTEQVQAYPGQRWTSEITLPPLVARSRAEEWLAFLTALNGREGTFLMGDPMARNPMGSVAGALEIAEQSPATAREVLVDGMTPSQSGILLPGDYFQLGAFNDARLYKVVKRLDSDGSGEGTLAFWPALRFAGQTLTPGEELIDGGLENWNTGTDLTNWAEETTQGTITQETTTVHGGTYSAALNRTGSSNGGLSLYAARTNFITNPGPYVLTFWTNSPMGSMSDAIFMRFWNNNKDIELMADGQWRRSKGVITERYMHSVNLGWQQHRVPFWWPSYFDSTDTVYLIFGHYYGANNGTTIYFDDISITGPTWEGQSLITTDPRGAFRLASNDPGWNVDALRTYGIAFAAEEALNA